MNEKVESLILEHLRAIRSDMARMTDRITAVSAEVTAVRQQLHGLPTLQDHDHTDIGALKARVDRIERRLDLID